MILRKVMIAVLAICFASANASAQQWVRKMQEPGANFYTIQNEFNAYWNARIKKEQRHKNSFLYKLFKEEDKADFDEQEKPGWEVFKRWESFMEPRVYPSGNLAEASRAWTEYSAWLQQQQQLQPMVNPGNGGSNGLSSTTAGNNSSMALGNWTFMGPDSVPSSGGGAGRVNFIRFDPTNSNTVWVSAPAGGLWKSTNGGVSWTTNTDQLAVIGVSDVAIDSTNTSIMYLATGDGDAADTYSVGVLKSINGGSTWNTTGLSWTIPATTNTIRKLLINPSNTQIVYAASSAGIYRTANGGTSWLMVQSGDFKDIEFKPGNPNVIYASTSNSTFFRSINGGTTFSQITSGLTTGAGRFAIGVTNADSNYVYILAANNSDQGFFGLYQSTNGGTSFTSKSTSPNVLGWADNGGDTGGQGWYDLSIAVSPINKNLVLVGGVNIWKSTDGGSTWSIHAHWTGGSAAPYVHADIHALEFLPGSGTTYFAGCDGGLFKTSDNGVTWTDKSHGLRIGQMYRLGTSATNATLNLSGHQDNGTNRYNGSTWSQVLGGDGMECIIDYSNANIMYGEVYYGDIYKSTNGGANFSNIVSTGTTGVNSDGDWVTPYIMCPQKNTTLLVGKDQVYRSRDGGASWAAVGSVTGGNGSLIALAYGPADSTHIYAAKSNKFYASTNGTSFTDRTTGLPVASASITYIAVSNIDANKVWVTFSGYSAANKVWYSADAGATWSNSSTGLPNLPANCIVRQNGTSDALYVGTDVGIYYRDNSLASWTSYSTGLPNVIVKELEIHYASNKIRAATFGRGLWQSDLYCLAPSIGGTATASPGTICAGATSIITLAGSSGSRVWQTSPDNTTFTDIVPSATGTSYTTPALSNTTYFRCALSNGTCSTVYSVSDTVKISPTAGAVLATPSAICTGSTSTLTASGYIGTIQWQSSTNNVSFANITGATSPTYITPALSTTTYYRSVVSSGSCASVNAASDTVVVNPVSVGGTANASPSTICSGSTSTLTLTGNNGSVQWQSSPNNTTFTNIAGANSASYITPALNTQTFYRGLVTSTGCASANSSSDTVHVNPLPAAATGSSMTICKGMNIAIGSTPVSGNSYAWAPSTGLSATNVANPIATPSATTTYTLTESSPSSSCSSSNTITLTVNNCGGSSIAESSLEEGLHVFPNPAKDELNIHFVSQENGEVLLLIFNAEGKMVRQEKLNKVSTLLEHKVAVNGLANGMYQLKVVGSKKNDVISFEIR